MKAAGQAIAALGGASVAGGGATRVRRTQEELEEFFTAIWDTLAEQPGLAISALAEALEATTKDVRGPSKALLEEGHVRKNGERRGTQYFTKGRRPF